MMIQGDLSRARNLVRDLQERGFRLEPDGDKLHVTPGERLTPAETEALKRLKCCVLETLEQNGSNGRTAATEEEHSPAPEAQVLTFDGQGQPCPAEDAWAWQWRGEPILYSTAQVPVGSRAPLSSNPQ
jgi:hypothetical protein